MKRNSLTTAVMAGIAGVAGFASLSGAVELNPDGLGQVLIYPYYTVNAGQQTLVSVVNTTDVAKAVKVRFLEGYDSREVLDFNVFLSPFDVWTSTVFALGDAGLSGDGAAVGTRDNSCTAPDFQALPTVAGMHYQAFLPYAYTGANEDTGPTGDDRTREGHFEMISMADLTGGTAADVTHDSSGVPADCTTAQGLQPGDPDILPPTGGIFGAAAVVNTAQGTFYSYNADAIDGFTATDLFSGTSSLTPSLAQANTGPGQATAYVFGTGGALYQSTYPAPAQGIDAVSAVFAADGVYNEYNVDADVGSNTDWVVTFPTKRFYVDPQIVGSTAIPPFVEVFGENTDGNSCAVIGINIYDREEQTTVGAPPGFSPPPPGQPNSALCKETNVISFLDPSNANAGVTSGVLGSKLVLNIKPFASAGWMKLGLNPADEPHAMRPAADGDVYNGLPVTGFEAVNYINTNAAPGSLANYSGLFRHRVSRSCTNTQGACS